MPIAEVERKVLETLDDLGVVYGRHEHPPVATVEEAEKYWGSIKGTHCKNLFLRNKRGNRHYLVVAAVDKAVDLKRLNALLGEDRLSFASAERLKRWLGLEPGSVSPFGLINDAAHQVDVICDEALKSSAGLGFHPNINTATLEISLSDFEKFLASRGNTVRWLKL
ncbi:MAG TPA: prolyl-tRNA synthetase associated domain-containing protein [Candidatus Latescibacteria bacterium]|nr:prolyl-tRNA synthetase associated domain-containing protein [Candidatus Latescibacterota bacterium]